MMLNLDHSLYYYSDADFHELVGKTITNIEVDSYYDNDAIIFTCSDGSKYLMTHDQDCCELVFIESVTGNFDNLLNTPIIMAEDISNLMEHEPSLDAYDESYTWTFYKLATINGYVTIRWYGTSNGYYSERVEFVRIDDGAIPRHLN